jgi:hypothetical protein
VRLPFVVVVVVVVVLVVCLLVERVPNMIWFVASL